MVSRRVIIELRILIPVIINFFLTVSTNNKKVSFLWVFFFGPPGSINEAIRQSLQQENHQQLHHTFFEFYIFRDYILLQKDKKKQLSHIIF